MSELTPDPRNPAGSSGISEPMVDKLPELPSDDEVMDMESMLADLHAQTESPGLRERVLSLPTPVRVGLAALAVGGTTAAALTVSSGIRGDLGDSEVLRGMALPAALAAIAAAISLAMSLRGPDRPPLRGGWALALGALLSPLLISLIPVPGMDTHGALKPIVGCFSMGSVVALATAGGILFFSRWVRKDRNTLAMAATAGGLVGLLVQQLHCAANDLTHLLTAHGLLALVIGGLFGVGAMLRR